MAADKFGGIALEESAPSGDRFGGIPLDESPPTDVRAALNQMGAAERLTGWPEHPIVEQSRALSNFLPEPTVSEAIGDAGAAVLDPAYENFPKTMDYVSGVTEGLTAPGMLNIPTRIENAVRGTVGAQQVPMPFEKGRPFHAMGDKGADAVLRAPFKIHPLLDYAAGKLLDKAKGESAYQGLRNVVANNVNALQTPEMLVESPLLTTPLGRLLFAEQMGTQLPERVEQSARTLGDTESSAALKLEAIAQPIIEAGMTALISKGPKVEPAIKGPAPAKPSNLSPEVEAAAALGVDPIRRLGMRISPNALEGTPELPALAERALQESTGRSIHIPGEVPAIDLLRRQQETLSQSPASALLERSGGGEALGGKVSFAAPAEAGAIPLARKSRIGEVPIDVVAEVKRISEPPAEPPTPGGTPVPVEPKPPGTSPEGAAPVAEIQRVASLPPQQFRQQFLGGFQQTAEGLGAKAAPETIEPVLKAMDGKVKDAADLAQKTGHDVDLQSWIDTAFQRQFVSEAYQSSQKTMPGAAPAKPPVPNTVLPATDLVSRLQSLKFGPEPGRLYSLPHPEALAAIGKTAWNNAIDLAIVGVKAGKTAAAAIEDALAYLRKNVNGFDFEKTKLNLGSILERESQKTVVTKEALSDSVKMRKLSERGTTAESIPTEVQKKIAEAPESQYPRQSMAKVGELVRGMSESELAGVSKSSDLYTAAKLEQVTRLLDAGKNEAGLEVFNDLTQELTRMGQVINQAKMLNALKPEHVVKVVNEELRKAKRDPLTTEQSGRLRDLSKKRIEGERSLDKATDQWTKEPTDANAVKAEKALIDANKAALEEQRLVHKFQGKSTASLIKAILQGNLLTPISQVANIGGNINFLPFRAAVRTIASTIDILDSYIRIRPREVSVAPISGTKAALGGLVKGVKEIPDILMRGTSDIVKGEARAGIHPLRAWITQFAKNPDAPTVGGRIPFSDRVNLAIEGTFGIPAEIMLRGLGAGDIAFRESARARLISEQGRLQRLNPIETKMSQSFPELFFDKETLNRIESETRGAIFQRHSKTLDHITSWTKERGDIFDLLVATVAPYKLTPWNIVGEILSYNPLVAIGRSIREGRKGNIREAEMNIAKAVVAGTLAYAGAWLYNKGLLAPSMDSPDEQQKARILAGEVLPPNHVNVSGLKRALSGGDPTFKAGDETRDVFRAGGLAGSMLYMAANVGRDAETKPESEAVILSLLKNSTLEQARFGLNQSFLKGVTGVLDAVRDGDADNWIQNYASTVLSIPLPNTLSALSRAERQYKVDPKPKDTSEQITNPFKMRLGFAGLDDALPLKRGLWGEPLPETPKDRNALLYHFFDITKGKQVTDDPVSLELYRLWRKTADTSVIPTPPGKTLTFARQSYVLTPEQQSRVAELVGSERKSIADRIVINPNWHKLADEQKMRILQTVYDRGSEIGKRKFWMESGGKLTKKPERAGFTPQ